MLGDDFAGTIQNRAARVLGLTDNRRVTSAKERVLHLLDDAGQARLNDLEGDGINGHKKNSFEFRVSSLAFKSGESARNLLQTRDTKPGTASRWRGRATRGSVLR